MSSISTAGPLLCQSLFENSKYQQRKAEINVDLDQVYWAEILDKSNLDIQAMNVKTLADIKSEVPPFKEERLQGTDLQTLTKLYTTVMYHKVVSPLKIPMYDRPGEEIGYCFGRATYVHLKLLSLGIQKESIQKIWAVGPMKTIFGNWGFHVATMVYTIDNGWMVVDTFAGKVTTVAEWMEHAESVNTDGRIRFYNTDASKFGLSLGKYNRDQFGLDMQTDLDWYRGYFHDMMTALKEEVAEQKKSTNVHPFLDVERSPTWKMLQLFLNKNKREKKIN